MYKSVVHYVSILTASGALAVSLTACAPVPAGCNTGTAKEIRTVDRLIADTQSVIAQGYRMESAPPSGLNMCLGGATNNVGLSFCSDGKREKPVAIDRQVEQRKLEGLKARRVVLAAQQATEAKMCGAAT